MKEGTRVRISSLLFLAEELRGKTCDVTSLRSFIDNVSGDTFTVVTAKLDQPLRLNGITWELKEAVLPIECFEVAP